MTMKTRMSWPLAFILAMCFSVGVLAQTAGTLTFKFTPTTKSPGYSGTRNYLAVWIQTNTGAFVKTKLRYAQFEVDHLPTWAVNSGGTASNCLAAACNKTDATTGATLTTFAAKTVTWDGKNVNGASNGTVVADGVYKVTIEETWNHGTSGTIVKSFTFTKGVNTDHQAPANDAYFTNVTLDWVPVTNGIENISETEDAISVYPNPNSDGVFHVDFEKANNVKVVNMLGMAVYDEKVEQTADTKTVDLTNLSNGIYFIYVTDGDKTSKHKVILNK